MQDASRPWPRGSCFWQKEQNKFTDEINDLKATAKDADERYRSLENKLGDLEEERSRLIFQAKRAESNANAAK